VVRGASLDYAARMTQGDDLSRAYKIKAETWLAVAIICFVFVAETSTTTRFNFNPPTRVMLGILALTIAVALMQWFRFYRLFRTTRTDA